MKLRILSIASREVVAGTDYYTDIEPSLGAAFWREVDTNILWIHKHYLKPRLRSNVYRRVNLQRFPYYIAYVVHEDEVVIVAVAHSHRKPDYWIQRVP